MSTAKYTPGPWAFAGGPSSWKGIKDIHICGQEEVGISICFINTSYESRRAEAKANARLIAAAPTLLEALKKAREELAGLPRSLGYSFTHLPMIDEAIDLATKDQP